MQCCVNKEIDPHVVQSLHLRFMTVCKLAKNGFRFGQGRNMYLYIFSLLRHIYLPSQYSPTKPSLQLHLNV